MRIQKWSACIWGLVLAAYCREAIRGAEPAGQISPNAVEQAQFDDGVADPGVVFDPSQGAPPVYQDPQFMGDPNGGGPPAYLYQQGAYPPPDVPDTMRPFPEVTPYEPQFNQTNQDSGLWFNRQSNAGRVWYCEVDMWFTTAKGPAGAEQRNQVGYPILLTTDQNAGTGAQGGQIGGLGGGGGQGQQGAGGGAVVGNNHFIRDLSTADSFHSQAVQPTLGYTNVDESGLEIGGFYVAKQNQGLFENEQAFPVQINRGNSNTGNLQPGQLGSIVGYFPPPLPPGVVLNNNGQLPAGVVVGTPGVQIQPLLFDKSFIGNASSRIYSGDINWLTTPMLGGGKNKLRGMYGVRYYGLEENINFTGENILLGSTYIESKTFNQLVGPQGGLRWDIGGKSFKLTGTGKVGALFNFEEIQVVGYNYLGTNSDFRTRTLHMAPTIDLTIMGQFPLFSYLPLVNRIPYVREAQFNIGYNYSALFLVTRPADAITYDILSPRIEAHHVTYTIQGTRLGMSWTW